jgi:hypothetical protein
MTIELLLILTSTLPPFFFLAKCSPASDKRQASEAIEAARGRASGDPVSPKEIYEIAVSPYYRKDVIRRLIKHPAPARKVNDDEIRAVGIGSGTNIDAVMNQLPRLANVKDVCVIGVDMSDERMKKLALVPNLASLTMINVGFSDEGAKRISQIKTLKYLNVWGAAMDEAAMKHLANLQDLQSIGLTLSTETGLKEFTRLKKLEQLSLGTPLSDSGMKDIGKIKTLKHLSLSLTNVTPKGLKELTQLKELETLSFAGTYDKLTDASLQPIGALSNLTSLDLTYTAITDAGMSHLLPLEKLSTLNLSRTNLTDNGLMKLTGLKGLRKLELGLTRVTANGRKAFAAQRKDVAISVTVPPGPRLPGDSDLPRLDLPRPVFEKKE